MTEKIYFMLLSSGAWPALVATGHLASHRIFAKGDLTLPLVTSAPVFVVTGFAIWSSPMLLAAALGVYDAKIIGALGWATTFYWLYSVFKTRKEYKPPCSTDWCNIVVTAGLLLSLFLCAAFATESIEGGRDMGVYANHGVYIANEGRLDVPYPWDNSSSFIADAFQPFPGFYDTKPTMTAQFAHVYPVWLAQAFSSFGPSGLFRLNSFLSFLSLLIFYSVCRHFVPGSYATIATLFFAFNASQLWIARTTLTEVFTQLFIWTGILYLLESFKRDISSLAAWAGLCIGFSAFIRIDSFILVPLLFMAHWFSTILKDDDGPEYKWLSFYKTALPVFVISIIYYYLYSTPYFFDLSSQLSKIGLFSGFTLLILIVTGRKLRQLFGALFSNRLFVLVVGAAVFLTAAYAYWIRPYAEPFGLIDFLGDHPLNRTRDYRENSLVNLATYLSAPVVWLGIFGWVLVFWKLARNRVNHNLLPLLLIVGGVTAMFLWKPSVSPDHYWAIRRFVPVTIPGVIFFSTVGFYKLTCRQLKLQLICCAGFTLYLAVFTFGKNSSVFRYQEYNGYYNQLQDFASKIPKDGILLSHDVASSALWETPLTFSFGLKLIPIDLFSEEGTTAFNRLLISSKNNNSNFYLLFEGKALPAGIIATKREETTVKTSFFDRTVHPLPTDFVENETPLSLYKIHDVIPSYINATIGSRSYFGIREEGFHIEELEGQTPVRWTNGKAKLVIPLDKKPKFLHIHLNTFRSMTGVKILLNGHTILNRQLAEPEFSKTFYVENLFDSNDAEIEIISDTFRPIDVDPTSKDSRELGVIIKEIRLVDEIPDQMNLSLGVKPIGGIEESGFYDPEIQDNSTVRWTNGNARIVLPVNPKRKPRFVSVDLSSTGPNGSKLKIFVNNKVIFHDYVGQGTWFKSFQLPDSTIIDKVSITIQSDIFVPKTSIKDSNDSRKLGVLIKGIKLSATSPN